jgi:hypothetical protein
MGYATGLSNKAARSDYAPHEIGDASRSPSGSNVTANALFGLARCVDQPEHNVRRSLEGTLTNTTPESHKAPHILLDDSKRWFHYLMHYLPSLKFLTTKCFQGVSPEEMA